MTKLKLIAGALVLLATFGAGAGAGRTGRGWLADKDKAEVEAAADRQARAAVAVELAAERKALATERRAVTEKEGRLQEALEANKNLSAKLREAYAAHPETAALAAMCLPDDVMCLLQ